MIAQIKNPLVRRAVIVLAVPVLCSLTLIIAMIAAAVEDIAENAYHVSRAWVGEAD